MDFYFKAVTLGAFTFKNEERITLLFENIRKTGNFWLVLHFLLITLCLNFPVTFQIARIPPEEFFNRLFSGSSEQGANELFLPQNNDQELANNDQEAVNNEFSHSSFLIPHSNYGRDMLNPMLGFMFLLTLIIQAVFYLCAVFFLGISRTNVTPLSFRDRMGLVLFSSTLPVLVCSLFGLFLPTVHILIFYFIIIFVIFHRSKLCPNG
jgi:hypothetical protein